MRLRTPRGFRWRGGPQPGGRSRPRVVHVAAFNRNVGDNALNVAIDRMLGEVLDIERMELVGNSFDAEVVDVLSRFDAIIFGGGGVIHSCSSNASHKNRERTGTMWNMALDDLAALPTPMILYGVGYNRFEGEPEPLPVMVDFFDVLRDRGDLIRFRNDGSIARLAHDLPALAGRFSQIPDPGLFCRGPDHRSDEPFALVQVATDRPDYRFPEGLDIFLDALNVMLRRITIATILLPHTKSDDKLYARLASRLEIDDVAPLAIDIASTDDVMGRYRSAQFTISTRGHAQICSLGNGTPTFAVSTHPKVAGFMYENGLADACFDLRRESLPVGLAKFDHFLADLDGLRARIDTLNDGFRSEIGRFNADVLAFVRRATAA